MSGGSNDDRPELSVVVVNWNGAPYLGACLDGVRGQRREVLVVDNGSSDDSEALVRTCHPDVRWLGNDRNLGFACAANRGLREARGRHVLFLNPDARANDEAIAAAVRVLDERPQVGLVGVAVRDAGGALTPTVEPFLSPRTLLSGRSASRVRAPGGGEPVEIDWCYGAFLLGRRADLLAIGGFDEAYFLYAEDMDLCFRLHAAGRSVVYLPQVSIVHEGNLAGRTLLGERRAAAIFASGLVFLRRRRGAAATLAVRGLAALFFGARALAYRLLGSPLAARYAALTGVAVRGRLEPALDAAAKVRIPAGFGIAAASRAPGTPAPVRAAGAATATPVTIAVPCRADEPALDRTLAGLEAAAGRLEATEPYAVRFAICVNGAGASRRALGAAHAFAARQPGRVEVIVEERADKARAWNLIRAACTTPLVVFCDADVEVEPDALKHLLAALEREPGVALVSARQVPLLGPGRRRAEGDPARAGRRRDSLVARAAALPYRFDFQVVGGRLYAMRACAVAGMPEGLLLEDGWLSAELGNDRLRTARDAEVYFHPAATLADYFRERLRTEAGKIQIREQRARVGHPGRAIARYPWRAMLRELGVREAPLLALNVSVRLSARALAEVAARRGRPVAWAPVASSKPVSSEVETS